MAKTTEQKRAYQREYQRKRRAKDPEGYRAYHRKWWESHRDSWRPGRLLKKYGVTLEQYDAMFALQKGVCAACKAPPDKERLAVDHCHETGLVRGLLCGPCNRALGLLRDCPHRLQALKDYIGQFNWIK